MRRVLVTGGAGFIGSALVRRLVAADATVLVLDTLSYAGNLANLLTVEANARYGFARVDVRDAAAVRDAFGDFAPEHVVHCAAESHVDRSIDGARAFVDTNVTGAFVMLEEARRYWSALDRPRREAFRFLLVSTDEVYGSVDEGQSDERAPYDPSSPYAASKAAADHLASAWAKTYGFPSLISNGSNTYGPHQFPEKLVPLTILNALHGAPLPVYGDGRNVRDWLRVDDHAAALDAIVTLGRPGRKYNVGAREERSTIDVVRAVCAIFDRVRPERAPHASSIAFVADRPGHDRRYAVDTARIEADLAWRTTRSFERGLEETVAWYLDNEWWWRPLRAGAADGRRLGLRRAVPDEVPC